MAEPINAPEPETVVIHELARGYRVDVNPLDDATGRIHAMPPTHFPTLALAREFASRMAFIGRLRVVERLKERRP